METLFETQPKKTMTPEQKAKIAEALAERRENRSATRIEFGNFAVFQADEWNWVVEKDGDESSHSYFPDLAYCIQHVLTKEIGKRSANRANNILAAIKEARDYIAGVVRDSSLKLAQNKQ